MPPADLCISTESLFTFTPSPCSFFAHSCGRHILKLHINPRSEPYDPYLPRNGSSSNPSGNPKTAAIQQQIDDTVGIMRENITKVAERGERLDSLQDKTGEAIRLWQWNFDVHSALQTISRCQHKGSVGGQTEYERWVDRCHFPDSC